MISGATAPTGPPGGEDDGAADREAKLAMAQCGERQRSQYQRGYPLCRRQPNVSRIGNAQHVEAKPHRKVERGERDEIKTSRPATAGPEREERDNDERQKQQLVEAEVVKAHCCRIRRQSQARVAVHAAHVLECGACLQADRERKRRDCTWVVVRERAAKAPDCKSSWKDERDRIEIG